MNTTRRIVLIVTLPLLLGGAGVGAWILTEPQHDAGSVEAKACREYVEQLDKLNRYKFFWTFIQRRVAYNSCMERRGDSHNQP
jgi:hypothetical protein